MSAQYPGRKTPESIHASMLPSACNALGAGVAAANDTQLPRRLRIIG